MLRRVTSQILALTAIAIDGTGLMRAGLALLRNPGWRLPALVGWAAMAVAVHLFTGERATRQNLLLATLLGCLIAAPMVALLDLRTRLQLSTELLVAGVVAVLLLHVVILVRAIVASGSADSPYDE